MKWIEALKIFNQGQERWCIPRRGSPDYDKVRAIQQQGSKEDAPISNLAVEKERSTLLAEKEQMDNRIRLKVKGEVRKAKQRLAEIEKELTALPKREEVQVFLPTEQPKQSLEEQRKQQEIERHNREMGIHKFRNIYNRIGYYNSMDYWKIASTKDKQTACYAINMKIDIDNGGTEQSNRYLTQEQIRQIRELPLADHLRKYYEQLCYKQEKLKGGVPPYSPLAKNLIKVFDLEPLVQSHIQAIQEIQREIQAKPQNQRLQQELQELVASYNRWRSAYLQARQGLRDAFE